MPSYQGPVAVALDVATLISASIFAVSLAHAHRVADKSPQVSLDYEPLEGGDPPLDSAVNADDHSQSDPFAVNVAEYTEGVSIDPDRFWLRVSRQMNLHLHPCS
jgi:hypothetical protein